MIRFTSKSTKLPTFLNNNINNNIHYNCIPSTTTTTLQQTQRTFFGGVISKVFGGGGGKQRKQKQQNQEEPKTHQPPPVSDAVAGKQGQVFHSQEGPESQVLTAQPLPSTPAQPPTAHALCSAAARGDLLAVKDLFSRGAPANIAPTASGLTALHAAAVSGHAEIVDFFVNIGNITPLLVATKQNITPLHVACARNRFDVVKVLCQKVIALKLKPIEARSSHLFHSAIDVRANQERVTPLHLAVRFADKNVVEELLKVGANPTLFTDEPEPQSPVTVACIRGDVELLKLLFLWAIKLPGMTEKKVVELASPISGATPLQIASGAGHLSVVKFLVEECDADPKRLGKQQQQIAVSEKEKENVADVSEKENDDISENLENELNPHHPLYLAAYSGHVDVLKYYLEEYNNNAKNDSKNDKNENDSKNEKKNKIHPDDYLIAKGVSALHAACRSGSVECVKLLLKHGANKNLASEETGITPLHIACLHGHLEIVKLLMPPPTSAKDLPKFPFTEKEHGYTCLHLALVGPASLAEEHREKLKQSKTNQQNLNHHEKERLKYETELEQFEMEMKHTEVLEYLLKVGFGVECAVEADTRRYVPLHLAAEAGNAKAVSLLLPYSMKFVNTRDTLGVTPLHAAASGGDLESVKLLVEVGGADIGIADRQGETAILMAKKEKKLEVTEYLQRQAMAASGTMGVGADVPQA